MHAFFFFFFFLPLLLSWLLAIEMELDTDLLASYLRVSLVCYLLLLLLRQVMYVRLCKRHIGLYCITSYMNSNNNNRHMHACLVCELLASYMHVAHSFPVRIPYMNLLQQ